MANALPTEANIKLAALLRECAGHIEQNEFHPSIYKALGGLHEYAAVFQSSSNSSTPTSKQMDEAVNSQAAPPADVKVVKPQVHEVAVTKPYVTPGGIGSGLGALGSKFKKGLGLSSSSIPGAIDSANRQATSTKNADRIKADLAATSVHSSTPVVTTHHEEWCETHFVMGCACKFRQPGSVNWPTSYVVAPPATTAMTRPAFSRPSNPNTNLIANGWIEQQRRSKMRIVWKDILASLVEGRKPGEETTLWIQREISNPTTGKTELEALHQIPVKWLEDVKFLDFYGDHRFSIKVYNVADEFLFKCVNEDAAQNWVLTLLSIKEIVNNKVNNKMVDDRPASDFSFGSTATTPVAATTTTTAAAPAAMADTDSPPYKMSIKELRALANGAGINTTGMERSDLEKAVSEIPNGNGERQQQDAEQRKRQMDEDEIMRRQLEEQQRQRVAAAVTSNVRKAAEEADAKRLAERQAAERQKAEEEQRRIWQQQVEQRKRQEDAVRVEAVRQEAARQEAARQEAARQQVARDEAARQQAAREEAARQQAAREEAARQQAARDEAARQQAAREEAAQREAYAKQQWAQQQAAQQAYAAQQQQWAQQQAAAQAQARAAQQQAWQAQQQQQQQYRAQQPDKFPPAGVTPPQPAPPPPKPPNSGSSASSVNQKYANMANGGDVDGQATIAHVKRNILIHWALQPPMLQSLRPIHLLLSSVHTVFPPAFGVPGHAYFGKWKAVTAADLGGANPDEEKLKKAVRQLRFFLHPDKLPKDLSEEQTFMCKMLWDVANDSWEEHHKKKEDLDWIKH